jgi:hypothetical protein
MTVEGAVEAKNDRGIKLGGEWRNVSRFKPLALPELGARVRADIDDKGFLKTIEVLDEGEHSVASSSPARDRQLARLAVLKAAAAFCAGKALNTDVSSKDVLAIAESWLAWLES